MPSPESNRSNLDHARSMGRVKFWRSRSESQRVKAEILQAYFAVPQPSQRAVAQRLHCKQPYICKLFRKIRREGPEKAIGWEAYEHYKALRDAELTMRHEALVAGSQHSQGQTPPPTEPNSQGYSVSGDARHDSSPDAQVKAAQNGPTEYVELARSTTGEVIELHGSKPYQPPTPTPPQQASNCRWVKGTLAAVVPIDLSHVDAAILTNIGYNPNRSKGWFDDW